MRFLVRTGFAGTVEVTVEADSEKQAFERADRAIDEMDNDEFNHLMEPQRMYQDADELDEEEEEPTKHPIASKTELEIERRTSTN
jgi:hypothetical protein